MQNRLIVTNNHRQLEYAYHMQSENNIVPCALLSSLETAIRRTINAGSCARGSRVDLIDEGDTEV